MTEPVGSGVLSSNSLLQRIARGDQAAVPECLSRYGGLVWSLSLRHSAGDRSEAEDATQEIFLDLWKHCGRFDPARGSEEVFVAMIARRRLIDRLRRASHRPATRELPIDLVGPRTRDAVEDRDEVEHVMRILAEMPEDRKRVLILSIHHGLTHQEIATRTGIPLGTVKTHVRRGLIVLRGELMTAANATAKERVEP